MRFAILCAFALSLLAVASGTAPAPRRATPQILACGQIRCQTNNDCPAECGPCVTWSGTCALFGPR